MPNRRSQTHADEQPAPTEVQRRYVLASRQGATRRLRTAMLIALAAVVAIASLAVIAVIQARDANETAQLELSRRLASDANAQLTTDPQLSLLLALEAYDTRPTIEAESAVRQATLENRERAVLHGHRDEVTGVAISPDGTHLATSSFDHTARVWDLRHPGEQPVVFSGHTAAVNGVAFSPDGTHVATASDDHTVQVWDWRHPHAPPVVLHHDAVIYDVTFSPDGEFVATATDDHTAQVWDWHHPEAPPGRLARGRRRVRGGVQPRRRFARDRRRRHHREGVGLAPPRNATGRPERARGRGPRRGVQPRRLPPRHREFRRDGTGLGLAQPRRRARRS